jgi:hypothetical protein
VAGEPQPFPGTFPGTISTEPDVPRLAAAADLVCVGRVGSVGEEDRVTYRVHDEDVPFRRLVATVDPERVLKGEEPPGAVDVEFLQAETPTSLVQLEEGERALLFLDRRGERFAPADLVTAKLPASDDAVERVTAALRG